GTKILYMTGYSGEFLRADMLIPGASLIQRPFAPADVGREISKMLAGKPRESSREAASSHETAEAPKAATARTSGYIALARCIAILTLCVASTRDRAIVDETSQLH